MSCIDFLHFYCRAINKALGKYFVRGVYPGQKEEHFIFQSSLNDRNVVKAIMHLFFSLYYNKVEGKKWLKGPDASLYKARNNEKNVKCLLHTKKLKKKQTRLLFFLKFNGNEIPVEIHRYMHKIKQSFIFFLPFCFEIF